MEKKMKRILSVFAIIFAVVMAQDAFAQQATKAPAKEDALVTAAKENFQAIPTNVKDGYKQLKNNPATDAKYELGKMLYFEPRLSKSQLISCNTCHNLSFGGDDYQETSIGHGWQKGPRNAPTVLNAVYNTVQFWDGRAADLKEQAKGPIQAGVEMAATPEYVVEVLNSMPEYVALFKKAFPKDKNAVSFDNLASAIEIFEATLLTPNSKFDKFLKGDANALNKQEKAGLAAFIDKGCTTCHSGINLTSDGYYPFGVVEKPSADILAGDKGRFSLSEAKDDEFAFKAPTLRNVEYTAPYFHSGKVWTIEEAVALMSSAQLGIQLTKQEVADITALMKALTGDQPKMIYPTLPPSNNNTPKPVYK